ncbi:hypothetical protein [Actinokineospora diospyrosa]|uniref:Subtilisin inhibitor-like n=1 Tax=Actinokineospora diospyrosa TaxID=103728 RepID=A0ABT1IL89_9PSEU|nr:hypothetical protein [Actinokineospora diospyrosa]MCP2273419.1 hypothetical protein [Actinokineospora diospyrosa]
MRSIAGLVVLLAVVTGCSTPVTGSAAGASTATTTTTKPEPTTTTTTTTRQPTKPTTTTKVTKTKPSSTTPKIDESAPTTHCDRPFKGALGKNMYAAVVETPAGRLNCEQAAAILFDYYAARPEPKTGLPPFEIGPMRCNQVDEPALPQVVCADEDNIIYSMWGQT